MKKQTQETQTTEIQLYNFMKITIKMFKHETLAHKVLKQRQTAIMNMQNDKKE